MPDPDDIKLLVYALPLLLIWISYLSVGQFRERAVLRKQRAAQEAGLNEPPTLHPVIDPNICKGCGACVKACPEGQILGLIKGKAVLVEPANCIGHGACRAACPFDAIALVFGTENRGIDIPALQPNFETSRNGVYIAGELGGMGLIRNAITQGVQAVDAIAEELKQHNTNADIFDLIIVGAGPAGIAAALNAKKQQLKTLVLEQDSLGGTVAHFPRNKIVMTAPATIPLVGKIKLRETTKEALLELWQDIVATHKPDIRFGERLLEITGDRGDFQLHTEKNHYNSKAVLLCLGRRGTPRTLGVEGEELNKVAYSLIDPGQFQHQQILVVGGGDSALEAAISLAQEPGTVVTLSYRGGGFSRAKEKNRTAVESMSASGQLHLLLQSTVKLIEQDKVVIDDAQGQSVELANDAVIICAGGILPTPFLMKAGIDVDKKFGTA